MKKIIILSHLTLSCLFTIAQTKSTFKADLDTVAEEQIKKLEFLLTDLLEKGDIDTYSGYLTDDYIRINSNGEVSTKEQVLEGFRKKTANSKMYPHDLKVAVYGNTAILRAVLDLETKTGDIISKRTSLITKVFIRRNDKWYMASMQGTSAR